MTWKELLTLDKRDYLGLICWFLASLVFGFFCLPFMAIREVYQYEHYHLPRFEWEDVVRYSVIILVGGVLNICLIKWFVSMMT